MIRSANGDSVADADTDAAVPRGGNDLRDSIVNEEPIMMMMLLLLLLLEYCTIVSYAMIIQQLSVIRLPKTIFSK